MTGSAKKFRLGSGGWSYLHTQNSGTFRQASRSCAGGAKPGAFGFSRCQTLSPRGESPPDAGIGLFELSRLMGTSVEQIDRTYGHLLPDSLDRARSALDLYGASTVRKTLTVESG